MLKLTSVGFAVITSRVQTMSGRVSFPNPAPPRGLNSVIGCHGTTRVQECHRRGRTYVTRRRHTRKRSERLLCHRRHTLLPISRLTRKR